MMRRIRIQDQLFGSCRHGSPRPTKKCAAAAVRIDRTNHRIHQTKPEAGAAGTTCVRHQIRVEVLRQAANTRRKEFGKTDRDFLGRVFFKLSDHESSTLLQYPDEGKI